MDAHIRHLMAYKRFIEHIYTFGTFVNCLRIDEGNERVSERPNERVRAVQSTNDEQKKEKILGQVEKEKLNENFLADMFYENVELKRDRNRKN